MSRSYPQGSPQAMRVVIERVFEAIEDINTCLPEVSGVQEATAGLINSCTDFNTAMSVLSLQLETAICWLGNGGAGTDCNRPWPCDYLTINTEEGVNDLFLYDPFAPGFLVPSAVSSNGQIYFAPTANLSAYPMVYMTTASFPLLEDVAGNFVCIFQPQLLTFSAPVLVHVGGNMLVGSNASLVTLDIPVLEEVDGDMDIGAQLLVNVDIHTVTKVGGNLSVGGNLVETVNIDGLVDFDGDFSCGVSALTEAAVNYLLVRMDELVLTNRTVTLNNGSSAAPSGVGLTAKTNLEGRGCTVLVNP